MCPVMLRIVHSGNDISNQLMSKIHLNQRFLPIRRREIGQKSTDAFLGIGLDLAISMKTKDERWEREPWRIQLSRTYPKRRLVETLR